MIRENYHNVFGTSTMILLRYPSKLRSIILKSKMFHKVEYIEYLQYGTIKDLS